MSDEIQIDGRPYVSSKRAAQVSSYKQDYIGQLCRENLVEAKRIGGLWYVNLDSLYKYKQKADSYQPSPPRQGDAPAKQEVQAIVSFDGKDYISASRASEITGYNQDYIGQLARAGKVLSRQIAKRWYVQRAGIVAHKREKDALLAAVQAEAVGLGSLTRGTGAEKVQTDASMPLYFTYTSDESDLLPLSHQGKDQNIQKTSIFRSEILEIQNSEQKIPIRVVGSDSRKAEYHSQARNAARGVIFKPSRRYFPLLPLVAATVIIVLAIAYMSFKNGATYTGILPESSSALAGKALEALSSLGDLLEDLLAPEIRYQRGF